MEPLLFIDTDPAESLQTLCRSAGGEAVFCVCDSAFPFLGMQHALRALSHPVVYYNSVGVNPVYEDVLDGARTFRQSGCSLILAVGGGSTLDTAKGIAAFSALPPGEHFAPPADCPGVPPIVAVPSTAGTGSEATHFAVIYRQGVKHSVAHPRLRPVGVYLRPALLKTLPGYQKRCTVLDALAQALESWWSRRATGESRRWSKQALELLAPNLEAYCRGDESTHRAIMEGAHRAGRAIDLAQTTAAHAMSYKLTTLYGLPHGHAVALCLVPVWRYMTHHAETCRNGGDADKVRKVSEEIARVMGYGSVEEAQNGLAALIRRVELVAPGAPDADLPGLVESVNPHRLSNNPCDLDARALERCYREALGKDPP